MKTAGALIGVGEVEWVGDAEMKNEEILSMMCWNVSGWCRDGREMEQMREGHDNYDDRSKRFLQTRCVGIDRDMVEGGEGDCC